MHHIKADVVNKEAKSEQIIRIEQEQLTRHLEKMAQGMVEARRRESSVEEALVEMYLAGISVRRV